MKALDLIAKILLIIGGLNWGLVGLAEFNVVDYFFGGTILATIVYVLVGLSAVWGLISLKRCCSV